MNDEVNLQNTRFLKICQFLAKNLAFQEPTILKFHNQLDILENIFFLFKFTLTGDVLFMINFSLNSYTVYLCMIHCIYKHQEGTYLSDGFKILIHCRMIPAIEVATKKVKIIMPINKRNSLLILSHGNFITFMYLNLSFSGMPGAITEMLNSRTQSSNWALAMVMLKQAYVSLIR